MDQPVPLNAVELVPGVAVPETALQVRFVRGRGPGGQNVNKLSTACELRVSLAALSLLGERALARLRTLAGSKLTDADEILISADEFRSQEQNRRAAIERLSLLVKMARVEPKKRRKTRPTRASRERRIEAKKRRGQIKSLRRGNE
jgi:ribosome-associated protein